MPLLFISHSSKDKVEAEQLAQWLKARGFHSLFLDSDAQYGIKVGCSWEKTLYHEVQRSHVFILLLSENWINSQWCGFELKQARALGKTILPLRIQPKLETTIAADLQHLDLSQNPEEALQRLQTRLSELALNSRHNIIWDNRRSPFPGMRAFETEDSPVFFGRDNEITLLSERLDQHRIQGSASLVVMLAASGAGKSSLLKAGLLPRLLHGDRHWLVTVPFRPKKEPLLELAQVLSVANEQSDLDSVQMLLEGFQGNHRIDVLRSYIQQLHSRKQEWESTLLITIDQAEELFTTAKPKQTNQFLDLLAEAQEEGLPILTLMAMRSDYLEALQQQLMPNNSRTLLLKDLFTLDTLPLDRIGELIRGPAEVAGLKVEDGLLSAARHDATTADALPLLAFALRELYERFGKSKELTLDAYNRLGSDLLNPLENAVQEKAARAILPEQLSESELKALKDAFIPHMVRVNDKGDYVRQSVDWSQLPIASYPLLDKLTKARLLVKQSGQIEVAHEALLRHWPLLYGWLREEHDFLLGKQQLEHSLRDWQKLPEQQRDKGLLRGLALERGREWLFSGKTGLNSIEKDFIRCSHEMDEQQLKLEERKREKERNRLLGFSFALVLVSGFAFWEAYKAENSRDQADNVINFMVYDLQKKLESMGKLDILWDVQERVSNYYQNTGTAIQSLEYSKNLINQGDNLIAKGKAQLAEKQYQLANQSILKLVGSNPLSYGWQHELARSFNKLGDSLFRQEKYESAKIEFEKGENITKMLIEKEPLNAEFKRTFAASKYKIGRVLFRNDKLKEAKRSVEESKGIFEELEQNDPSDDMRKRDLYMSINKIGEILEAQNKYLKAQDNYIQGYKIIKKLSEKDPSNAAWKYQYSISLGKISVTYINLNSPQSRNNLITASTYLQEQRKILKELIIIDPKNANWQGAIPQSLSFSAIVEEKLGNDIRARAFRLEALGAIEILSIKKLIPEEQAKIINRVKKELKKVLSRRTNTNH